MTLKRVNARIIDCSKVKETTWLSIPNEAGRRFKNFERLVSFYAVFPNYFPGEILTLYADQLRLEIDGKNIKRETFVGRWGGLTEGFVFEDFKLSGHGQIIPVIAGYAVDRAAVAHA